VANLVAVGAGRPFWEHRRDRAIVVIVILVIFVIFVIFATIFLDSGQAIICPQRTTACY
jgi:hypothetical protein